MTQDVISIEIAGQVLHFTSRFLPLGLQGLGRAQVLSEGRLSLGSLVRDEPNGSQMEAQQEGSSLKLFGAGLWGGSSSMNKLSGSVPTWL